MNEEVLQIAFVVVLAWFLFRLLRTPRDYALWAVVACVSLRLLGRPSVAAALESVTGSLLPPSMWKLVHNLALNGAWYALLLFFILSAAGPDAPRKALREAAIAVAASAVMACGVLMTPAAIREQVFQPSGQLSTDTHVPGVMVFYAGLAYFCYAAVQTTRWMLVYGSEAGRRARWGFRLAAAALLCIAAVAAFRVVVLCIRWAGGDVPGFIVGPIDDLVPICNFLFLVGVSFAGLAARVAAFQVWLHHRRVHHELRPLWERLNAAFPHDALDAPAGPLRDWLSPRHVHRRFLRRVVEVRDGLVQLSPYLADAGYQQDVPAHEQPEVFREAFRLQREGVPARSTNAIRIAEPPPGSRELDFAQDADQLVKLARAL